MKRRGRDRRSPVGRQVGFALRIAIAGQLLHFVPASGVQ